MIEYKVVESPMRLSEGELNQYAKEGWKLCEVLQVAMYTQSNRVLWHYIWEK